MHFNKSLSILTITLFTTGFTLMGSTDSHESKPDVSHEEVHDLDPFVVSASLAPRNSRDMLNPTTVVAADELDQVRSATIGDMLDGQPGVHATAFGAGASRPVIRGMEGVRLKVMESGVDSGDLSADSPDHATAVEPFFIERVEVLRGASTLLFGSSAIGGAVNVIDRRVPRELPEQASVDAMLDFNSAADGWTYAAIAEVPMNQAVLSASYLERDHEDYSIPGHAELEAEDHDEEHHEEDGHEEEEASGTLENSFLESSTGSFAGAWFPTEDTRISIAWQRTDSLYGVPGHSHAHEEEHGDEEEHEEEHEDEHEEEHHHEGSVAIDLTQSTLDIEMEHRLKDSWLQSLEGRVRIVDYEHQELEGEEIGTDFDKDSVEARMVATHLVKEEAPGAIGVQWSLLEANAVGEESLTPESETRDLALYLLQEWHLQDVRIEGGLRAEHRDLDAMGTRGYNDWAFSASAGSRWNVSSNLSLGLLFNHAQRHPTATELFANGPHAATRQFEIGNADLDIESANGLDLSLQYSNSIFEFGLTAFATDFTDYIYASPTDEEQDGLTVYRFRQVDVDFIGFEAESNWHVWHGNDAWLDIGALVDWVDTDIRHSWEELPRIPPARAGLRLRLGSKDWTIGTKLIRSFKQDDTAVNESPTDAYTNWIASFVMNLPFQNGNWRLALIGENLLDEEIRIHTSPIKDLAPAPGRHVRMTVSVAF